MRVLDFLVEELAIKMLGLCFLFKQKIVFPPSLLMLSTKGDVQCQECKLSCEESVFEGVVVPTVTYGVETWNSRMTVRHMLDVVEIK